MEIHELNTFSGTPGAGDYLATDNGTDTSKISVKDITDPLNARIDNIIVGGDAPSEAEVTDARLGATVLGSVRYASLGDAIRGQAESLYYEAASVKNTILNEASPDELKPFATTWEQGAINNQNGKPLVNASYIRTINTLVLDNIAKIKLVNNASSSVAFSIQRYNNLTGAYIGRYTSAEIIVASGASRELNVSSLSGYFKFVFKYTPTATISPTDGQNVEILTTNFVAREISYIERQAKVAESKGAVYPALSWAQGSVDQTNMYAEVNSLNNYIRTNILTVSSVDRLNVSTSLTDSYYVYCRCYDEEGNQISSTRKTITSTNILEFDVSAATFVRLIVAHTDTSINILPSAGASFGCYFNNQIVDRMINSEVMSNLMASFKRFAVIGDSLSAGHIYPDPSTTAGNFDDKSIAWGTWITRKLDNTYYNFSRAGMDAYQFVRGIREADQSDLGDNKLAVALDGDHDVPLYIINLGVNNPHGLDLGTTADIDLSNPDNNGNTVIGWYSKLVQKISNYYENNNSSVHIVLNVYGFMPAGGEGDEEERLRANGRIVVWTKSIYDYIKATIEGQGNFLHFLDLYSNDPEVFRNEIFMYNGAVVQKHWTSVGYNAVGMAILRAMNELIWNNSATFNRVEFIAANSYIDHYNNPSNFT